MTQTTTQLRPNVSARELTLAERNYARKYLDQTRREVAEVVKRLNEEQWNFKLSPEAWSTAKNVEHLVLAEMMLENILTRLPESAVSIARRTDGEIEAQALAFILDRSTKHAAAVDTLPAGHSMPAEVLDRFLAAREHTAELLDPIPALRTHVIPLGVLGPLDGYEWVLATAAHSARHAAQILELKSDPKFPAAALH